MFSRTSLVRNGLWLCTIMAATYLFVYLEHKVGQLLQLAIPLSIAAIVSVTLTVLLPHERADE